MSNSLLFVISNLRIGGSELYLISIANSLVSADRQISILILGKVDCELLAKLDVNIKILRLELFLSPIIGAVYHVYKNIMPLAFLTVMPWITNKIQNQFRNVHCFDMESLLVAKILFSNVKLTTGIYHSNEFTWTSHLRYKQRTLLALKEMPMGNVYSDKRSLFETQSSLFDSADDVNNNNIFPMGISLQSDEISKYDSTSSVVISAARLVGFKGYIKRLLRLFQATNELASYKFLIIGDGPLRNKWENLSDGVNVQFLGELPIEKLEKELVNACLYVGSGTTCIIAALLGIPTIVATEGSSGRYAKGFFHELEELKFFKTDSEHDLDELVACFLRLSHHEKNEISECTKHHVRRYAFSTHVSKFDTFLMNAKVTNFPKFKIDLFSIIELLVKDLFKVDNSFRDRYNKHSN